MQQEQRMRLAAATAQGAAIARTLNEASFIERYVLSDEAVARSFFELYFIGLTALEQSAFRAGFLSVLKARSN